MMHTDPPVAEAHVSETDAFTFRMERDPLLRSTIVAVAVLDRSPDWDHFRRRIDRATRLVPTFRQKLVESPLRLAPPRWVVDPDFDLSWHVRRAGVVDGGGLPEVLEVARTAGMTAFDHDRPLWEATLLEGLTGGRSALVMKVHHALTDGIGGIQIANHAVDLDREPVEIDMPAAPRTRHHDPVVDLVEALGHEARVANDAGRALARAVPGALWRALTDPVATVGAVAATSVSLARFVRPVVHTRSRLMRDRRLQWHYDLLDVPLRPMKAAAARVDGTLNDAFVSAVAGGVRLYHDHHGTMLNEMRMSMPISLRTENDAEGGNHITLSRFDIPVGRQDPLRRMREIGEVCRAERAQPSLAFSNQVAGVLNLLPSSTVGSMLKHVDMVASNVPGFPIDVFVSGALVESFHAFGPTTGTSANVTLMSYRDTCHIGVTTDTGAIPDPDLFLACLRESFAEITALGTPSPRKRTSRRGPARPRPSSAPPP